MTDSEDGPFSLGLLRPHVHDRPKGGTLGTPLVRETHYKFPMDVYVRLHRSGLHGQRRRVDLRVVPCKIIYLFDDIHKKKNKSRWNY